MSKGRNRSVPKTVNIKDAAFAYFSVCCNSIAEKPACSVPQNAKIGTYLRSKGFNKVSDVFPEAGERVAEKILRGKYANKTIIAPRPASSYAAARANGRSVAPSMTEAMELAERTLQASR